MSTEKSHIALAGVRRLKLNHDKVLAQHIRPTSNSSSSTNDGKDTRNQVAPTVKMAQKVMELATNPDDLNSIPKTHICKDRDNSCKLTCDLNHMHAMACVHCVHTYFLSLMYSK